MKKGIVISLAVSHRNLSHIFKTGDSVTENEVNDFDKLVKTGHLKEVEGKKTVKKPDSKKSE